MRKINTETVALTGVTAAVYMVATLAVSPIAFGAVQFRLSEVMVLLAWINPAFAPGLILGSVMLISRTKNMYVASIWPTVFSFIIGLELYLVYKAPFIASTISVMIGELICITLIGCVIFTFIKKNGYIMAKLQKF